MMLSSAPCQSLMAANGSWSGFGLTGMMAAWARTCRTWALSPATLSMRACMPAGLMRPCESCMLAKSGT